LTFTVGRTSRKQNPISRDGTVDRVTTDPLALAVDLEGATTRLIHTAAGLDDAAVAGPSALPGWTRGHVLAHLSRNADALGNLLTWARTGVETPAYASLAARAAGIEADAYRPAAAQLDDLRESCDRFAGAVADMPAAAWVFMLDEKSGPAARVVWRRLREVEVHHVDLDAGYTTAEWPEPFTHRLLHELITNRPGPTVTVIADELGHPLRFGTDDTDRPVVVRGAGHEIAGWLSGRSDGKPLDVDPRGPLPTLTDWM
jgi:maleylpyruvate isomerase